MPPSATAPCHPNKPSPLFTHVSHNPPAGFSVTFWKISRPAVSAGPIPTVILANEGSPPRPDGLLGGVTSLLGLRCPLAQRLPSVDVNIHHRPAPGVIVPDGLCDPVVSPPDVSQGASAALPISAFCFAVF